MAQRKCMEQRGATAQKWGCQKVADADGFAVFLFLFTRIPHFNLFDSSML
jgi:hypothetical protein